LADLLPPDHPKRRIAWQLCALVPARIVSVVLLVVAIITGSVGWWTIAMAMTFAISVLQPLLRRQLVVAIEVERRAFVALVA
jgi:hypothetical protein